MKKMILGMVFIFLVASSIQGLNRHICVGLHVCDYGEEIPPPPPPTDCYEEIYAPTWSNWFRFVTIKVDC